MTLAEPAVSTPTGIVLLHYELADGVLHAGNMDEENLGLDSADENSVITTGKAAGFSRSCSQTSIYVSLTR